MPSQITGVSSMATRRILADVGAMYDRKTGVSVAIRSMGGVDAVKAVRSGEPIDVVVLASSPLHQLEVEGHIIAGTSSDFVRSGIAVAVRSGDRQPDITDEQAVRTAMSEARSIGYSSGPSGDHLKALWQSWGLTDAMKERAVQAPPGVPVATLVARGDVTLGFQQLSELLGEPGIEVIGLLPPQIQLMTAFRAGVASASKQVAEARAFIAFLASPDINAAKRRNGLEPATILPTDSGH